jgi:hypothetical protein
MEQTTIKRRIWRVGVGMVAVALIVVAIWREWPRKRLLTEVARPVAKVDLNKTDACWLSNHQLLLVTTESDASVGTNTTGNSASIQQNWIGFANVLDTITGATSHLSGLTGVFQQTTVQVHPFNFEVSPYGTWLKWATWGKREEVCLHAARLDGKREREWVYPPHTQVAYVESFFLDNRHLVKFRDNPLEMIVGDLQDRKGDRNCSEPDQRKRVLSHYAVRQPVFVVVNKYGRIPVITTYRTEDRLQWLLDWSDPKNKAPQPIHKQKVNLPEGTRCQDTAVSPQQASILYSVWRTPDFLLLDWLHRINPNFNQDSRTNAELWVSRADGTGLREIGEIPLRMANDRIENIQWLPDGKQISFIYHNILYVVPAEPGK